MLALASPAVKHTKLFEAFLEPRGFNVIWPKRDDLMLRAIRSIKTQGPSDATRNALRTASDELKIAGADLQFVACSEFSIIADSVAADVQVVDTIDLLVTAIVAFSTTPHPE